MVSATEKIKVGMADYTLAQAMADIADLRRQLVGLQSVDGNAPPKTTGSIVQNAVTSASDSPLSDAFTIDGGDAQVATTYRLTTWGSCTWGSTQQAIVFALYLGGVSQATAAVGATQFAASAGIRWQLVLNAQCATTGAAGTWSFNLSGFMSLASGNLLAGIGANGTIGITGGTGTNVTQDTTVNNDMQLQAHWGATTGSPTITCRGQSFERIGP